MKFVVDRTEIITEEDGFKYIAIFDKNNKNWYEEQKKFKQDTLKVLYRKDTCEVLSWHEDVSKLAPTESGDVVEEVEKTELEIEKRYYFADNKIVVFEKPSRWHTWNKDKFLWELNLDKIKEKKREELKSIREEKIAENIEVHGSLFQVREKDLENFEDVARAIRREKRKLTDRRMWVIADNSVKEFTYAELLDVLDERAERKDKIFAQFAILSMQLEKCENVDDIEKIKWE